jgi:hypothetical protein
VASEYARRKRKTDMANKIKPAQIICDYCHTDGGNGPNEMLFNGFKDGDNGKIVCWSCRDKHYQEKALTEHKGLHSEFPIKKTTV